MFVCTTRIDPKTVCQLHRPPLPHLAITVQRYHNDDIDEDDVCNAIICNDDIFDNKICDAVVIGNPVQLNME